LLQFNIICRVVTAATLVGSARRRNPVQTVKSAATTFVGNVARLSMFPSRQ